MKEIKLTQGKVALVDDADFEWLNQWSWYANKSKRFNFYAVRTDRSGSKQRQVRMHRLILGLTDPKIEADHKDFNGLNNQRENLRSCNHGQNISNRKSKVGSKSKYLGVHYITTKKKNGKIYTYPCAAIFKNKVRTFLGRFKTEEEAALAYNNAAIKIHGEFANLNIIPDAKADT